MSEMPSEAAGGDPVRFEDLTVDDDMPILDRVVMYCQSQVALQRLVHVKMLAETASLAGYVRYCIACTSSGTNTYMTTFSLTFRRTLSLTTSYLRTDQRIHRPF